MARDYYYRWKIRGLSTTSSFQFSIGSTAITATAGEFMHIDTTGGGSGALEFAADLQTLINLATGGAYTVTFSASNLTYTISNASAFTMTFASTTAGDNAANILGFPQNTVLSSATSHVSTRRPFYVTRARIDGQSEQSDEYEPGGCYVDGEADNGTSYGIGRLNAPIYLDWKQPMEQPDALTTIAENGTTVFRRDAAAIAPWTWQDAFVHARNVEPICLYDSVTQAGTVAKMREDQTQFTPQRVTSDYQGLWHIPFRTRLLGRFVAGAPPAPRSIVVAQSLSNVDYWQLVSSSAINGSATMTIAVVYRAEVNSLGRNVSMFRKWTSAARGYAGRMLNATDRVSGTFVNGTPANASKTSTAVTIAAGSFYTNVYRLDTSVGVDVFFQGVKNGSAVACAAYTAATSADTIQLGRAETSGAAGVGVAAVVIAESTAVSDANITAWHAQVVAGNTWTFPGGGTTHVFYAGDIVGSSWADQIASVTLGSTGSPTVLSYTSPVFP